MTHSPRPVACPACRRPAPWDNNPHRPFCSADCKSRDLGRWATESYRVPEEESTPADDEIPEPPPPYRKK